MAIPGDSVREEDVEDVSSVGYRTPPPDFMGTSPPSSAGKTRKRRKTREPFYKGYGVVYLPGDIKGLTDNLHLLSRVTPHSLERTGSRVGCTVEIETADI